MATVNERQKGMACLALEAENLSLRLHDLLLWPRRAHKPRTYANLLALAARAAARADRREWALLEALREGAAA